jgi:hypothetical protein
VAKNMLYQDCDLISQVKNDLEETRSMISKVDKYCKRDKNFENPERLLHEISNVAAKSQSPAIRSKNKSNEFVMNDQKQMIENSEKYPLFS